jgi:hypothetical protein
MTALLKDRAATYVAVSVAALRKWRFEGRRSLYMKIGRLVRYRSEDGEAWLASHPQGSERLNSAEVGGTK